MLTTLCGMAAYIACLAILGKAVERWPFALPRFAFVPVGREVALPVPAAVLARLETVPDEKTTYREPPSRKLVLASFPGELRVEREHEIVRFLPERNCVVARRRVTSRGSSLVVVRVDVSSAEGCLRLRGRYVAADEVLFLLIAGCWLVVRGTHPSNVLWVVALAAVILLGAVSQHRTARACFDAAVDATKRRIAAADPNAPRLAPAASATPTTSQKREDDERLPWTCACGKVNEVGRKTCRRCWSPRYPSA
jgi:hypothetical protein